MIVGYMGYIHLFINIEDNILYLLNVFGNL